MKQLIITLKNGKIIMDRFNINDIELAGIAAFISLIASEQMVKVIKSTGDNKDKADTSLHQMD